MKKAILYILVVVALVGVVVFMENCQVAAKGEIKLGVIYALTGPASVWTEYGKKAIDMAVEDINAAGGINGKKLVLVIEDSKADPKTSVSAMQKLVSVDHVSAVIGDVWSFITNPLIPIAEMTKVPVVSPTVMNKSVERESEYFFTVGHTVESQEDAINLFFVKNPQVKTVYNLCWNDNWGKAHSDLLKQVAARKGVKIIGETCTGDFSADYRSEALKVKQAHPDAVFITTGTIDPALKALSDIKVNVPVLTTTAMVEAVRVRNLPIEYTKNGPDPKFLTPILYT